jgi:hypothetical protein
MSANCSILEPGATLGEARRQRQDLEGGGEIVNAENHGERLSGAFIPTIDYAKLATQKVARLAAADPDRDNEAAAYAKAHNLLPISTCFDDAGY